MQLAALMLLEQETVLPNWQVAVAVQRAFSVRIAGRLAAWRIPLGGVAQELAAGRPRIAARASLESGAWLGVWPKPATATKRREQARIDAFFISSSFGPYVFLRVRFYSIIVLDLFLNRRDVPSPFQHGAGRPPPSGRLFGGHILLETPH
jgi:DNA-binding XRE family transcriptional regulator